MTRVQLHPATDRWMMGDRYGEIVSLFFKDNLTACAPSAPRVKLDKSGKTVTCPRVDLQGDVMTKKKALGFKVATIAAIDGGFYIRHPDMGSGWTIGVLPSFPGELWCFNPHTGSEYAYTASGRRQEASRDSDTRSRTASTARVLMLIRMTNDKGC